MPSDFDDVAELYDVTRPGYPAPLFDDLLAPAAVEHGASVLEVGAGSGQATIELARRGLSVLALEPGPRLAERARMRLAGYDKVAVLTTTFEGWPPRSNTFELVVSATAFHWVDQTVAYEKAFECLKPTGWIGLFWNRHVAGQPSARFYEETQALYRRWAPALVDSFNLPSLEEAKGDARIEESGLFGPVTVRRYSWQESYDARRYTDLLRTYSDHLALADQDREGLLADIERLIEGSFGNRLVLDRATVLYAAQAMS